MNKIRLTLIALVAAASGWMPAAGAAVSASDLPGGTLWYVHVDLAAMRASEPGSTLFNFFKWQVFDEINDEIGVDLNRELDRFTAFSDRDNGTVILLDGPISKDTKDKLLALMAMEGALDIREHDGKDYFFVGDNEGAVRDNDDPFDDLEDSAYFSFDIDGKAIITSNEARLHALLESGGRVAGAGSHNGAIFVLTADKSFVQAGMRAGAMADQGDDDWESNILRNTEQAALLISDANGMIAVQAELVSTEPKMAQAIGGIVNGLISLQAFNSELDPEIQDLIRNTKVEVRDNRLEISTVVDAAVVGDMLSQH